VTDEEERKRYDSLDDQIYDILCKISGINVFDVNLRDHPEAHQLLHKFANDLQSEAYDEGRKDEAALKA
jgi:hypothetical protein